MTNAEGLKKITEWLDAHDAIEEVSTIGIGKCPMVFFNRFKAFQRIFGGLDAKVERKSGWNDWSIESDGMSFRATEMGGNNSIGPVAATVPPLAADVPQEV